MPQYIQEDILIFLIARPEFFLYFYIWSCQQIVYLQNLVASLWLVNCPLYNLSFFLSAAVFRVVSTYKKQREEERKKISLCPEQAFIHFFSFFLSFCYFCTCNSMSKLSKEAVDDILRNSVLLQISIRLDFLPACTLA